MSNYGDVAVRAADRFQSEGYLSPRAAWDDAAGELLSTVSLREKGCPRATFLSLCQAGLVIGIPPGDYTRAQENRDHALEAVGRLAQDPTLAKETPLFLWRLVTGGGGPKYNQQMDVVLALWRRGLIATDRTAQ
jgi:hypothetical protein